MLRTLQVYLTIAVSAILIMPASIFAGLPQAAALRIKCGAKLALELEIPLNTATAMVGDIVWFRVTSAVSVGGPVAIPPGTRIKSELVSVKPVAAHRTKLPEIQIQLQEILLADGESFPLSAAVLKVKGKQSSPPSAGVMTQGVLGQLLSGVMGGGRSAAIGAAITIITAATQPRPMPADLDLPAGTHLEARLERDLDIPNPERLPPTLTDAAPASVPVLSALDSETDATTSAQPDGSVMLKVNVDLVQVNATVRDRSGRPMTGLQREDFRLFEDGVEQQIQKLCCEKQPLALALITDGLSVDLNHTWNKGLTDFKDFKVVTVGGPAYQLVQRLKPGDAVSLFSIIDHPRGVLKMHEALTTDHQRIAWHIDGPPLTHGLIGIRAMDYLKEALLYLEAAAPERRRVVILTLTTGYIDFGSQASVAEVLKLALKTDTAIYAVGADYSADQKGIPGIVLGHECDIYHIRCDRNGMPVDGVPPWPPFVRLPGIPVHQAVYDPVRDVVKQTGGQLLTFRPGELTNEDCVAFGSALAAAIGRLKGYTLSYAPAKHPDGSYHSVEVRLTDRFGKPSSDYTVHSRTGYYGTASANGSRDRKY